MIQSVSYAYTKHIPAPPNAVDRTPECHLLRLPGELRNKIFELFVSSELRSACLSLEKQPFDPDDRPPPVHTVLADSFDWHTSTTKSRAGPSPPTLAVTCTQIRHEVLSIFYGRKVFTIGSWSLIPLDLTLLAVRAPSWLPYVRNIECALYTSYSGCHVPIEIVARTRETGELEVTRDTRGNAWPYCMCIVSQRARDVNAGLLGSSGDVPMLRFLKSFPQSSNRRVREPAAEEACGPCGKLVAFCDMWLEF